MSASATTSSSPTEILWLDALDEGLREAQERAKPLLLDFNSPT